MLSPMDSPMCHVGNEEGHVSRLGGRGSAEEGLGREHGVLFIHDFSKRSTEADGLFLCDFLFALASNLPHLKN